MPSMVHPSGADTDHFDFIIVGAGAAGCVLANRLSADPAVRVALIEAGPSDRGLAARVKTALPMGNIFLLPYARYNWQHSFSGGAGVNGRQIACPRGRLLGGSTSVNGTIYVRGHRLDYDDWRALGNEGWSYADVLPAFKAQEKFIDGAGSFHGADGEVDVQQVAQPNPLAQAFIESAVMAGHTRNDDFNGAAQDGFGLFHVSQRAGVRMSSSRAFLHPVIRRPNLVVITDALVERLSLRGQKVMGVSVRQGKQRRELQASAEVVLAAGTVNSAQLLLLSGIGPEECMTSHGIKVRHVLPGVGHNLQDHPSVPLVCSDPTATAYALSWRAAAKVAMAPWKYALKHEGMLASNGAEAGGFLRSSPEVDRPDLQLTFMVGMKENARMLPRRHGFICHVAVQRPATRGTLTLASPDPMDKPIMRPGFLEDRRDVSLLIHGLREARRIASQGPLAAFGGTELGPGPSRMNDDDLEAYIRNSATTTYHPVGTCKMGPGTDPTAVVDPQLRVHGLDGLRVADASIMPNIVSGNTAAASMMIGQRAANFILAS